MDTTILPQENRTFVLHPLVGKAAMKLGYEQAYRWYLALRGAKRDGICYFTRNEIIRVFEGFGWDRTQYYRLTKNEGFNTFFRIDRVGNVSFRALRNVCWTLGTSPGYPVEIDVLVLKGNVSKLRSAIYASGFSRERTIGRGRLSKEYGVSHNTQRKYEQENGVSVSKNHGRADTSAHEVLPIPEGAYVWEEKGTPYVRWQLPNTYHTTTFSRVRSGQAKHIGKAMRCNPYKGNGVQRRRPFLVNNWKGDLRGNVMLKTGETCRRLLRDGSVESGNLYEFFSFNVGH
ncbi:hypothetical protein Rctr71_049 [Virus Rctr71]|nr:hypothetical protein Rctr71_049 [Virus Rctr71]